MEPVWALGLMSGTSFDGVDAATLLTDGETVSGFGPGAEFAYAAGEMDAARAVHRDWRGFRPAQGEAAGALARAEAEVTEAHAAAAARLMARGDAPAVEIVGFHGQTVAHAPDEGWTWQLGRGDRLARALGRDVAWDFRSADMAAGGQGAPLVPFFHHALARRMGGDGGPVCFLNLGGVGNVSWVDPGAERPETPGALIGFDTGPANAPIDDWMQAKFGTSCDFNGEAAAAGRVHEDFLARNSVLEWISRKPPKSLDRNDFAQVLAAMEGLSPEDGAATLTALAARCAAGAAAHLPRPAATWILCGGGRRNPTLARMIAERVEAQVISAEVAGFDGGLMEAQAFAWLAVRVKRGLPLTSPDSTGCRAPTPGGRLSRP